MAHKHYMALALAQARRAAAADEVPIGAVLVNSGQVVASAHNVTISVWLAVLYMLHSSPV
jgi:tRNA(Arg) A34 adenosine deaminase TadA